MLHQIIIIFRNKGPKKLYVKNYKFAWKNSEISNICAGDQ